MIKNCLYMMKKIWKYGKLRMILSFALVFISGINTFVDVSFYKFMIDGVTGHKPFQYILMILGIRLAVLIIYQVANNFAVDVIYPSCELKIARGLSMELYKKVQSIDIISVDDSEFYNKYSRAFNEIDYRCKALIYSISFIFEAALQVILVGVTLVYISPVVIVLAITGAVVTMVTNIYKAKFGFEFNNKKTKIDRGFGYIHRIFYLPQYAKEIRTTHIDRVLYKHYDDLVEEKKKVILKNTPKIAIAKILGESLFFLLGTGATSGYMLYQVCKGVYGIGDFVTANYAVTNITQNFLYVAQIIPEFTEHSLFINNYLEVLNYESKINIDDDAIAVDPLKSNEIELKDVSYQYPNLPKNVLNHINLKINPGEKIGLVGENGAGKSTLLKIIIRLYEPISGELALNGLPYRKITKESLMDAFSVVEQDYQHYAFSIKEDVAFDTKESLSEEKVTDALEKVDLLEAVNSLPFKMDSCLTNEFDEKGINLSGGQLQRLAISRMIYQNSGILIMDEPSSALDPVSEAKMFEIINKLSEGKTLILVSHRLSGVKDMDRILFMEDGAIVESGTHTQLMNKNGKYATMFQIQAERYGIDAQKGENDG